VLISLGQACSASHVKESIDKFEAEISELISNPIFMNNRINRQSCFIAGWYDWSQWSWDSAKRRSFSVSTVHGLAVTIRLAIPNIPLTVPVVFVEACPYLEIVPSPDNILFGDAKKDPASSEPVLIFPMVSTLPTSDCKLLLLFLCNLKRWWVKGENNFLAPNRKGARLHRKLAPDFLT
jgi:hypothetical protein